MRDPCDPAAAVLVGIGTATFAGHMAIRACRPLGAHVVAFLGVYAALCLLSLATALWLKRSAPRWSISPSAGRAALPWLVLGFAAALRLLYLRDPPLLSSDIYRYIWDGRVQAAGINPYLYAPSAPELARLRDPLHALINHPDLSTIYPPVAEWTFRLIATLSPTIVAMKSTFIAFDLLTIWLLMRLLSLRGDSPAWALLYAWHPLPVIEFAGAGHLDTVMMFLMVLGLYLWERGQPATGSAAFGMAAMTKLAPLVVLPWLLGRPRAKPLLAFFGTMILCAAPFAPGVWSAYRHGLPVLTGPLAYSSEWLSNPSVYAVLGLFGWSPTARKRVLVCLFTALSIPWAIHHRERPVAYVLGGLYALLLFSPVVQPWYVLWMLPLLCIHPLWSGLTWTWLVGFLYIVLDPRLCGLNWHCPAWEWAWFIEYGTVFALLLCEVTGWVRKRYRASLPKRA